MDSSKLLEKDPLRIDEHINALYIETDKSLRNGKNLELNLRILCF